MILLPLSMNSSVTIYYNNQIKWQVSPPVGIAAIELHPSGRVLIVAVVDGLAVDVRLVAGVVVLVVLVVVLDAAVLGLRVVGLARRPPLVPQRVLAPLEVAAAVHARLLQAVEVKPVRAPFGPLEAVEAGAVLCRRDIVGPVVAFQRRLLEKTNCLLEADG